MDVWGVITVLVRRWMIFVPALIVGFLPLAVIDLDSQAEYQVEGSVLLVEPATNDGPPNPYASSGGSQVLAIELNSSATRSAFGARDLSTDFEVAYEDRSPVIGIQVTGGTPAEAQATADALLEELGSVLAASQTELGIPDPSQVRLRVLDSPDVVVESSGSTRTVITIAVLGTLFAIAVTLFADYFMTRRGQKGGPGGLASSAQDLPQTTQV